MLRKLNNILIGWGKRLGWFPTSDAEVALSTLRMKQCGKCQHGCPSRALKLINGQAKYLADIYCEKCGCPVLQKSLVVGERCPLGEW